MKADINGIPGKVRKTQELFEFLIQDVLRGNWFNRLVFVFVVFTIVPNPSLIRFAFSISGLPLWYRAVYYIAVGVLGLTTLIVGLRTLPKRPNSFLTQTTASSVVVPHVGESDAAKRSEPPIIGPPEIDTEPALPEFTKIRLKPECEAWKEIGVGNDEFERNTEFAFAEDPVFEITVKNSCGSTLILYEAGIRLLQRGPGKGGGGCGIDWEHRTKEVQNEFIVNCPDEWKRAWGVIEDANSRASKPFVQPIEMNKDGSRFLFTLKLENFVDPNSSSSSEIRFYLVTENNRTAESRSIRLFQ